MLALALRMNESGACWPSLDLLAKDVGLNKTTVSRAVVALETMGLMLVYRHPRRANHYRLQEERFAGDWPWVKPIRRKKLNKLRILRRDKFTCQSCGASGVDLEVDHTVPLCLGGEDVESNTRALCVPCHVSASTHARSILARRATNPGEVAFAGNITLKHQGKNQQRARVVVDMNANETLALLKKEEPLSDPAMVEKLNGMTQSLSNATRVWREMHARWHGGFLPEFTTKEMGQFKMFLQRSPSGRALAILGISIRHWDMISKPKGMHRPHIGFLLTKLGEADQLLHEVLVREERKETKGPQEMEVGW